MNQLVTQTVSPVLTMTSLEIVEFMNTEREAIAKADGVEFPSKGYAKLEHSDFMEKVLKVIGEDARKFSGTSFYKGNGSAMIERSIYTFPKREACLMAMSYSYELQAKVFDRMTALESQQAPAQSDPVLACLAQRLTAASLFKIPEHLAQIEATKEVLKLHGVDFAPLLKIAPAQQNILREEESLEPTDLGKTIGYTGKDFNLLLVASGMQVKTVEGWFPTEEGKPYATVHSWAKGAKSGYNLKWRRSVLKQLDL